MARGVPDLPDTLLLLVIVSTIAAGGIMVMNAAAEASSFPAPFRDTAFDSLRTAAIALVLGIGAVSTVVGYLVWFAGSGRSY